MIDDRISWTRRTGATVAAVFAAAAAGAQVPTVDTEDATIGSDTAGAGRFHLSAGLDARNGDFARGSYDDDRADLDRLPVHLQLGAALDLWRRDGGDPGGWFLLRTSNGFHTPRLAERTAPRGWYESNTLAALVLAPSKALRTAVIYTVKASPNGIAGTTHEASLSLAHDDALSPTFVVTMRPKGDGGVYTQAGAEPAVSLGEGDGAAKLSLPLALGIGWHGFYGAGSGDRVFASAGAALVKPFRLGATPGTIRWEALALHRDRRLARLSGPDGETARIVPLVTWSVSLAY